LKRAEISSQTLAHPFRWRLTNVGVEKGAKFGSLTLAHPLENAGIGPGSSEGKTEALQQLEEELKGVKRLRSC